MRVRALRPEFVEFIPETLEPGVLYISIPFATASHLCACGCGLKVVTPVRPAGWSLTWNGEAVSLYPSIGNWNLPCRSHYWVGEGGRIEWAGSWSEVMIARGRRRDKAATKRDFASRGRKRTRRS